jgi:hypothetical protein
MQSAAANILTAKVIMPFQCVVPQSRDGSLALRFSESAPPQRCLSLAAGGSSRHRSWQGQSESYAIPLNHALA